MAQLVIAAAGAAIGHTAGWGIAALGLSGGAVGWTIGSIIGGQLFAKTQKFEQPRLQDLKVTGSEYGTALPWVQGHPRVAGWIAYASEKRAIAHTTSSGGKGGGGGSETTTYTYEVDLLYVVTSNEIADVTRVWKNGELIYTKLAASDADSVDASLDTPHWTRMTVYTGEATQLPDPTYEAAVGTANAPAYRGRGSVFIQGLQLDGGGNLPNLTFEVTTTGAAGTPTQTELTTLNDSGASAGFSAASSPGASPDGGLTILMGLGIWTNTYVRPFTVRVWSYSVAYANYTYLRSVDVFPDGADGDRTSCSSVSTDWPMWVGVSPRSGNQRAMVYDLTDGTNIQHYWSSFGSDAVVARRGATMVYALPNGVSAGALARFSADANATVPIVTNTPAAPSFARLCLSLDEASVYGLNYSSSTIRRLDSATLTVQESFAAPTADGRLFMWPSGNLGWSDQQSPWKIYERISGSWVLKATKSGTLQFDGSIRGNEIVEGDPWFFSHVQNNGVHKLWRISKWDTLTPSDETVQNVASRLFLRAGLAAGQFDVTALSTITRNVRGLAVSQIGSTRATLEIIAAAYFIEFVVSDKIYGRPRGSASVASIPYADLGASDGDDAPEPLALKQRTDIELPAHLAGVYSNVNDDYQSDTQLSDRLITAVSNTVQTMQFPLALTPSEMKGILDALALDAQVSLVSTQISLLGDYCRLEPTDPTTVTGSDGSTFRLRLVKKTDAYPLQQFDAVLDNVSALSSQGITSADYTSTTTVTSVPATDMELLDMPILRDADDDAGFYVAARGVDTPWPGAVIYGSRDDVQWEEKARVTESSVSGICTTTLGNYSGPRLFDDVNTVTVNLGYGTAASSTRDAVLNDATINAWLIGSEVIQAVTATLVSAGVYTLSQLLRGCRGTEWAMTGHATGERAVKLQMTGLRRARMETSELGAPRYYRGVTIDRRPDNATTEEFTNNGIGLKPFSPFDARVTRDASGNITITFQRRTRLAIRAIGTLGISVPLGEDSEAYDLIIYASGAYATVKRTIPATTISAPYSSADQTTDFGSNQNPIYFDIQQRSVQVGLGYRLRATA